MEKEKVMFKLLNEGGFGCIFRPEINCDNGMNGDMLYVSKIMKKNYLIQNEIDVFSIIQKIKNNETYFAGLISSCPAIIKNIPKTELQKCKILNGYYESQHASNEIQKVKNNFVSAKIRYVGKYNIEIYLKQLYVDLLTTKSYNPYDAAKKGVRIKIIDFYNTLLISLSKLNRVGIVHNDIKESNIVVDDNNKTPIIIDFGLAYAIEKLEFFKKEEKESIEKKDIMKKQSAIVSQAKIFSSVEFYLYHCIDIYIIKYIISTLKINIEDQTENQPKDKETLSSDKIDIKILKTLIDTFFKNLEQSFEQYGIFIFQNDHVKSEEPQKTTTTNEMQEKKQLFVDYFVSSYINKTWDDLYNDLTDKQNVNTWDNYSLAITFIIICRTYINTSSSLLTLQNNCLLNHDDNIMLMCKDIIFTLPNERNTLAETYSRIIEIIKTD